MLDVNIAQFVFLQLLVLIVSTAAGVVAFGFAMTMTPFLLIFLEPRLVVEINLVLTAVLFTAVAFHSWRRINAGTLLALLLGGAAGIPLGVLFTKSVAEGALSLTLTGVVIVTAFLAIVGRFRYFSRERLAAVPIGGLFTFINASLALGGPVVALFALNQRWGRDQTRAMLSSFFMVTGAAILASHAAAGLLGLEELRSAALFVPALIAGSLIASRLTGHINERLFRRLVLVALLGTSFGVLGRELADMV
ncbi:MAG: sulfite exporter TauE/SafE family protein [Dehalococcoidia bacterium]